MNETLLLQEINFKALRSSGPGGQHVNKTASKVELSFDLFASEGLSEIEKHRVEKKLGNRISKEGLLILQCGETRSQHKNKAIVLTRFLKLLKESLKVAKIRRKTKPSRNSIERRLKSKKGRSLKKSNRRPPKIE